MTESENKTGFGVPDVPTWSGFVSTGELARVLTRMCWLVRTRLDLGYRLAVVPGRTLVTIVIDDVPTEIAIAEPTNDRDSGTPLERVVTEINEVLARAGRAERFEIVTASGRLHERRRIVVDHGETLAPIDERVTCRLDEDGSLLGLVAAYVERLAVFAGLRYLTCTPRWSQDPGRLALTFEEKPPDSGGVSRTLELRYVPELEVQPILDTINGSLEDDGKRLYRISRVPGRVDVALLDRSEAAALRKTGNLIEQPAKEALRAFATAGFELEALYGEWRWGARRLPDHARRLSILAGRTIGCEVEVADDRTSVVTWIVDAARTTTHYTAEDAGRPQAEVLGLAIGQLNRTLATAGVALRCVVLSGRPLFWGHRMLLLDREWLARIARCDQVLAGCLDEPELPSVIGMYPLADPDVPPARLPMIEEIIDRGDLLDHDFKCSARPSDMVDLIEEIARFGRVAVEVDPSVGDRGDEFAFRVTHRGETTTVVLENSKYVNVGPIVTYLNALLDGRRPRRQLHYFRGGGWSGGLLRATDEQTERLTALGYI